MPPPGAHDFDIGLIKVESLYWSDRPDIVAAARFIAIRPTTGANIAVIDAYLGVDGRVEMWLDGVPGVDDGGDYEARAHEDWDSVILPMLAQAMEASVTR